MENPDSPTHSADPSASASPRPPPVALDSPFTSDFPGYKHEPQGFPSASGYRFGAHPSHPSGAMGYHSGHIGHPGMAGSGQINDQPQIIGATSIGQTAIGQTQIASSTETSEPIEHGSVESGMAQPASTVSGIGSTGTTSYPAMAQPMASYGSPYLGSASSLHPDLLEPSLPLHDPLQLPSHLHSSLGPDPLLHPAPHRMVSGATPPRYPSPHGPQYTPSQRPQRIPSRALYQDPLHLGNEPIKRPSSRNSDCSSKKSRLDLAEDTDPQIRAVATKAFAMPLEDVAVQVKMAERNDPAVENSLFAPISASRTSKIDRIRQVYALAWANYHCEASPTAVVPRNRIYARYVQSCADANLTPVLAPTFGRYVRVLFPGLKVRRLGTRGKSKYHYCGLKLLSDQSQAASPMSNYSSVDADSPSSFGMHTPSHVDSPSFNPVPMTPASNVRAADIFSMTDLKYLPELNTMIQRTMVNKTAQHAIDLPSVYSYLPSNHDLDPDVLDTLHSMYRVYCSTIFESMRYMQVEKMFSSIPIATATFTPAVVALLKNDMLLNWVRACDLRLYRAMVKMLSSINLFEVPEEIRSPLSRIASGFIPQLSSSLEKFPKAFATAKLKLASQFTQLIKRFLRCVDSAAAARLALHNAAQRSLMSREWARLDFRDIIMRELPCASEKSDLLLDLLQVQALKCLDGVNEEDVLHRFSKLMLGIPALFPNVNAWLYSLLCSNLLTSCIRELSIMGSGSFKSWWSVRCWVDEYSSWNLELGGFLYEEYRRHYGLDDQQEDSAAPPDHAASATPSTFVDLLGGWKGNGD